MRRFEAYTCGDGPKPASPTSGSGVMPAAIFKFAIVMDDKTIVVEMPWTTIRNTSEVGIAEYIIKQMREARDQ